MTTITPQLFHRHTFPPIKPGSHRRSGMYLHLHEVQHQYKTPKALQGTVIRPNLEMDFPVGAIIVQKRPTGTAQFGTWAWSYAIVPPQNEYWEWSPECSEDRFITFRDNVVAALQFAPRQPANGYLPDPNLAAPANFPRPPGPEAALAIARYAFANRPGQPPSPGEMAHLANAQSPDWLISFAAQSTPFATSIALTAALAFVSDVDTPTPTIDESTEYAAAYWNDGDHVLRLSAQPDGICTACRITNESIQQPGIATASADAMERTALPAGVASLSLPQLRDALDTLTSNL